MNSISIPDGVTSIREGAFQSCTGLKSVTFGENSQLKSIEEGVFYCCTSLSSIEIPEGVTSIGLYTFECCSSLSSIEIPNTVTSIGHYAFMGCTSLSSITLNWNEQELEKIISDRSISTYWLDGLDNLTTIYVTDDLVDVYKEYADELNLPESVTIKEIPESSSSNIGLAVGLGVGLGVPAVGGIGFGIYYGVKKKKNKK